MPLDDKVEKMNGGVYGVLKVLLGKAGNEQSIIDEFRLIGRSHLCKQGGCSFYWNPCIYNHLFMHCTIYHALYTMVWEKKCIFNL